MKLGSPFCEIVNCAELKHEVFADEAHQYDAVYSVNLLSTHSSEPNMAVDYVLVKIDGDIVKDRRVGRPILHILHTGCPSHSISMSRRKSVDDEDGITVL